MRYYKDVVATSDSFTFKYLILLSFLTFVLMSALVGTRAVVSLNLEYQTFKEQDGLAAIKDIYPENFEIKAKQGEISVNVEEPLIISMQDLQRTLESLGAQSEGDISTESPYTNLLVFYSKGTEKDFEMFDTVAMITSTKVYMADENNGLQVTNISEFITKDFVVTKAMYESFIDQATDFVVNSLPVLIIVGIALFYLFNFAVITPISMFFLGLMLFIVSSITKKELSFMQNFKIAVHTATLPFLLNIVVSAFFISVFPGWVFMLNLIIGIVIVGTYETEACEIANVS